MRYALDADVVIGALDRNDPHHRAARRMFTRWHEQDDSLMISLVNLTEVLVAPAADQRRLRAARAAITALGLRVHEPTEAIGVDAARLRARYPISLPDAYLLATARHLRAITASFNRKIARTGEAEEIQTTPGPQSAATEPWSASR